MPYLFSSMLPQKKQSKVTVTTLDTEMPLHPQEQKLLNKLLFDPALARRKKTSTEIYKNHELGA